MTPEQNLWAAVVDRAVEDSLDDPIGRLPEYTSKEQDDEWKRVRDKRCNMHTREWTRVDAKQCLMGEHMSGVYYRAHGRSIEPLRRLLVTMWRSIEKRPSLAVTYRKIYNNNLGNREDRREWA